MLFGCQTASWRLHKLEQARIFLKMKIGFHCVMISYLLQFTKHNGISLHFFSRICDDLKKERDLIFALTQTMFNNNRSFSSRKKSRSWDAKAIFYHLWFINKGAQSWVPFASESCSAKFPSSAPQSASFLFFSGGEWKFSRFSFVAQTTKLQTFFQSHFKAKNK